MTLFPMTETNRSVSNNMCEGIFSRLKSAHAPAQLLSSYSAQFCRHGTAERTKYSYNYHCHDHRAQVQTIRMKKRLSTVCETV